MSRTQSMTTHKLLNNFAVVVPESQGEQYAQIVGHARVITHPDTVVGLTPKRQWMLENLMDDECLVMLDDDVQKVLAMFEEQNRYVTDPDVVEAIIRQTYETARDIGAKVFTWALLAQNIKYFTGHEPFKLTGMIHGSSFGITADHNLSFNTEVRVNEDLWLSLFNAYKNRYCLKDDRFAFVAKVFEGAGGQAAHRTTSRQQEDYKVLRRFFGPAVRRAKKYEEGSGLVPLNMKLPY